MTKPVLHWTHGKDSAPWSNKSEALRDLARKRGLEMEALDFSGVENPDERTAMLVEHLRGRPGPIVLVGSSMGGYVSVAACRELEVAGLFLLNPALYLSPGYRHTEFAWLNTPATVLHGWSDDVVPVENAYRFARTHAASLHVLDGGHRLLSRLPQICRLFEGFLVDLGL